MFCFFRPRSLSFELEAGEIVGVTVLLPVPSDQTKIIQLW